MEVNEKFSKVRLSLALLAAIFMLPVGAAIAEDEGSSSGQPSQEEIDQAVQDCTQRWISSKAANTCLPTSLTADLGGSVAQCDLTLHCVINMDCTLANPCTSSSGAITQQGITWKGPVDEVAGLLNCSGRIQSEPCG